MPCQQKNLTLFKIIFYSHLLTRGIGNVKISKCSTGWIAFSTFRRLSVYEGELNWHLIKQKKVQSCFFAFYFLYICCKKIQTWNKFWQTKKQVGNLIILFLFFNQHLTRCEYWNIELLCLKKLIKSYTSIKWYNFC